MFKTISKALQDVGLIRGYFTFVDSSKIEACVDSWSARDKAIEDSQNEEKDDDGKTTMNNKNAKNYLSDKDARYGVKGNKDIWIGYKRHVSVDAHQGLILKVAVTPANAHDGKSVKHVLPKTGAILADKGYGHGQAQKDIKARGLHSMAIKNNNAKDKDRKKDAFYCSLRMPFEGVFSKMSKRARYRSKVKVLFQAIMQAMVHNIKRLITIKAAPIPIT